MITPADGIKSGQVLFHTKRSESTLSCFVVAEPAAPVVCCSSDSMADRRSCLGFELLIKADLRFLNRDAPTTELASMMSAATTKIPFFFILYNILWQEGLARCQRKSKRNENFNPVIFDSQFHSCYCSFARFETAPPLGENYGTGAVLHVGCYTIRILY